MKFTWRGFLGAAVAGALSCLPAVASDQFTYVAVPTVSGVSPNTGSTAGGTSVTIPGSGFTSATAVDFGASAATGVTVNSSSSISATSPAESAGTVNVTVTTPGGTSGTSSADQFTFSAAPSMALDSGASAKVRVTATGGSSYSGSVTVSGAGECVVVATTDYLNPGTESLTDTAGWTFAQRTGSRWTGAGAHYVSEWTAVSTSTLSDTITVNTTSTITDSSMMIFAVEGCATSGSSVLFDSNAPWVNASGDPVTGVTTANANDFLFAIGNGSVANPTAGAGFTLILNGSSVISATEQAIYTSTQSSLGVGWGNGPNDTGITVVDAIKGSSTVGPTISNISSGSPGNTTDTITWTTSPATVPSSDVVTYGPTSTWPSGTSTQDGTGSTATTSHSVGLSGLSAGTPYTYTVTSVDAGGTTTSGTNAFTTGAPAPTISNVSSGTPGSTTATITWTTNYATVPSTDVVTYGLTSGWPGDAVTQDGTGSTTTTSHSVSLSGLTASSGYSYTVSSTTSGGTTTSPSTGADTFTTAAAATAAWYQMHVGNGGVIGTIEIDPNTGAMAAVGNVYGGYLYNASLTNPGNGGSTAGPTGNGLGAWEQIITPASFNSLNYGCASPPSFCTVQGWAIQIAQSNNSDLYIGANANRNGLLLSTNSGATWTPEANFPTSGAPAPSFQDPLIAIDTQNPNHVFVSLTTGVWWTTTGLTPASATWTQIPTGQIPAAVGTNNSQNYLIAFNPSSTVTGGFETGIWVASAGSGVYYSSNANGTPTFTKLTSTPTNPVQLYQQRSITSTTGLWVADNSNYIYLCGTSSCVQESTWPRPGTIAGFAVSPTTGEYVIADASQGVWSYSCNSGTSWVTGGSPGYAEPASSGNDVPWMANDTSTWAGHNTMGLDLIKFDPSGNLWGAVGIGMFVSYHGASCASSNINSNIWTSWMAGSEELVPLNMKVPVGGCPVGTFWDRPIFKLCPSSPPGSTTGFLNTTHADDFPTQHGLDYTNAIRDATGVDWVAGTSPPEIVAVIISNNGGYQPNEAGYSLDGGQTWNYFGGTLPGNMPSEINGTYFGGAIAAASANLMVWSVGQCGNPYYTTNAGVTWTEITLPGTIGQHDCGWQPSLGYFPSPRENVIADKVNGVSNGNSLTFYMINTGSAAPGIYKSFNGITWTKEYTGLVDAGANNPYLHMRPNPVTAGQFVIYLPNNYPQTHVYECKDNSPSTLTGAITCAVVTGTTVNSYAIDYGAPNPSTPTQASLLYYGEVGSTFGAFLSDNDGTSWTQIGAWQLNGANPYGGAVAGPVAISGDPNHHGTMYICWTGGYGCGYYH